MYAVLAFKKSKDEDFLATLQADLELTRSQLTKADAESVVAEKNKDDPVLNYIQYIKSHFMKASESEFTEFRNQTNSLISKHEYNRAMEAKEATQPAAQPAQSPEVGMTTTDPARARLVQEWWRRGEEPKRRREEQEARRLQLLKSRKYNRR